MNRNIAVASGIAATAGLMYFFDTKQGRRRRAVVRDKLAGSIADSGDLLRKAGRDISNRVAGTFAGTRAMFGSRGEMDDRVLEARVHTALGRLVSHPASIHVSSLGGCVTLRGPVLARELNRVMRGIYSVKGVRDVDNQLEIHEQAGDVPGLQGGRARIGPVPEFWQMNWTPALRVLAGVGGGALAVYSIRRSNPAGFIPGAIGAFLLTRAVTNLELRRLFGAGAGRRALDFQKTLTIHAPVEEVFQLWSNYENFPRFMRHIREVRDHGNGLSHWVAEGPAGTSVTWNAEITGFEPNRLIAWKSAPGSMIDNAGIIHFESTPEGYTRVHMRLSYNPPGGAMGHAIAWLFHRDLKTELDEDLVRFKSLIETGRIQSREGESVTPDELRSPAS